jgi:hypothetical protein
MYMSANRIDLCRDRLIKVARNRGIITFGELAKHLEMLPPGPWDNILDDIYDKEKGERRPGTLLVVRASTGYPPYISRGGPTRSVEFDPKNREHIEGWHEELERIYQTWTTIR